MSTTTTSASGDSLVIQASSSRRPHTRSQHGSPLSAAGLATTTSARRSFQKASSKKPSIEDVLELDEAVDYGDTDDERDEDDSPGLLFADFATP